MKMRTIKLFFVLGTVVLNTQCSKESTGSTPNPTPTPEPEVVILQPSAPNLSFPNNNEPCLDSNVVNDNQSSITFRWNQGNNTESYQLELENLVTNATDRYTSNTTELTLTLVHAEPYAWSVTAIGEAGSDPAESATWKFYLSGPAQESYAPFPSELTSPISGSTVTPIGGVVELQWNSSDADNDLAAYRIYMDTEDATTLIETIDHQANTTVLETSVENGSIYFWRIVAVDAEGNESDSGIYSFRTN